MSIDALQEKIRKTKAPIVLEFGFDPHCVPSALRTADCSDTQAFYAYCRELMGALKGLVSAVRFSFAGFALMDAEGLTALQDLSRQARELGYFVFLDAPDASTSQMSKLLAAKMLADDRFFCDAVVASPYIGSDSIKPFQSACKNGKSVFVTVRSANKSASEIQDLLSGTRHVHNATAELAVRMGEGILGKCGYSQIGAAVAAEYTKPLRQKHNRLFFLVEGLDFPGGNAKNCSGGFDRFGHGAIISTGSILWAWKNDEAGDGDYLACAAAEAERIKRNLGRYVTVL